MSLVCLPLFAVEQPSEIKGRIVEPDGSPVKYASVILVANKKNVDGAITDTVGVFLLKGLYEGKYKLSPVADKSKEKLPYMDFEKCCRLIEQIACFSENAVISLSAWGEPLSHPRFTEIVEKILSFKGLSVFFETDGLLVTEELCKKLSEIEKAESRIPLVRV